MAYIDIDIRFIGNFLYSAMPINSAKRFFKLFFTKLNILDPEIAIITPIDFDHHKQLGSTLIQIASEKAGIIKNDCPVFLSRQKDEVKEYFNHNFNSKSIFHFDDHIENLRINSFKDKTAFEFKDKLGNKYFSDLKFSLLGTHQAQNACQAYLAASKYLQNKNIEFGEEQFKK